MPPDYVNLLTNPGFESDLAGWNQFNINGTVVSSAPGAHQGSRYFRPGTIEEGYIEQVVDLLGPNVTAGDIDGQDLELVFGGRIRAAVETPRDRGAIEIRFLDAGNAEMGVPVRVDATSTTDRWELVGGRIDIPTGARKAVYRFIADREQTSGTADAYLDGAFVYVRSEAQGTDLGAYGHTTADTARTGAPRIELRYPDLYADLEKDKPLTIRWETFGNAGESPVRIELWQDGANGPALRQTIAAATADDGEHIWIPSASGLDFGTYGLRIQVSLVNAPIAIDRSQETFAVPEAGTTYWVDDASNANDEYTPGGTGDNRHTGKRADAPKPYATNLLRVYELNAAAILNIDTGSYSMIDPVAISGSTDLGLGLDEGFTLRGPSDVAKIADLFPAIPGNRTQPVILLDDADNMSISGLTLRNALRGLEVRNGSDGLALSYITVTGHAQDGMRVDTNAPFSTFHHLTAYANTGRGIFIDGPIAGFTHGLAYGNTTDGIVIDGAVGVVSDSVVRDNGGIGLYVSGPGAGARVEANIAYRNNVGIQVYNSAGGAEAIVGQMDLSLGRGNRAYENRQIGIQAAYNTRVAGNTIQNQTNTFSTGLSMFGGASASRNVVSGNYDGISFSGGGDVTENRVYDNDRYGITGAGAIDRNVVYSNATNINAGGSSVLRNNLVYASVDYGIFLSGDSAQILGNTVHSTSGHAIRIQGSASNTRVRNNIVSVSTGDGLSVAADSQSGFASDYNLFRTTGTGSVGMWQGVSRGSLVAWQNATFGDRNSLFGDPLFVDVDGADGVLGYGGAGSDGRDDDFHERSQFGSFKGGALAPVRDGATGLPVFLTATLSLDDVTAPGIDRGAPADPFANEPANNGGYVNIGAYGNTAQASRSPAQYMLVTNPNGGEAIPQESTYDIRWRSAGFGGNVAIEYSVAAGAPVWQMLADDQANDGSHLWTVAPGTFAVADTYRIRVRSIDTPAIVDASNAAFSVTPPISIFYVNDGSTAGDQYTTAIGNDANDGLTAATPKATIRGVLEAYDLDAGDIIRVDNGSYLLTANIELVTQDSGVTIEGPTFDGLAAVLDRGNTSSTSFVFNLLGADDVTLRNLVIRGGYHGVHAGNAVGSDRLTVENSELIRNSQSGIYHRRRQRERADLRQRGLRQRVVGHQHQRRGQPCRRQPRLEQRRRHHRVVQRAGRAHRDHRQHGARQLEHGHRRQLLGARRRQPRLRQRRLGRHALRRPLARDEQRDLPQRQWTRAERRRRGPRQPRVCEHRHGHRTVRQRRGRRRGQRRLRQQHRHHRGPVPRGRQHRVRQRVGGHRHERLSRRGRRDHRQHGRATHGRCRSGSGAVRRTCSSATTSSRPATGSRSTCRRTPRTASPATTTCSGSAPVRASRTGKTAPSSPSPTGSTRPAATARACSRIRSSSTRSVPTARVATAPRSSGCRA